MTVHLPSGDWDDEPLSLEQAAESGLALPRRGQPLNRTAGKPPNLAKGGALVPGGTRVG